MASGEFDSACRETTDAYRKNWERIYQPVNAGQAEMVKTPAFYVLSGNNWPNGCPMLDEDIGTDQANGSPAGMP